MENLQKLLELFLKDQRVAQLVSLSQQSTSNILLKGIVGAQESFVLKGLYDNQARTILCIATDKEQAAYLQNDLASIFQDKNVYFFPDSFKRPAIFEELDNNQITTRTEIINKLSSFPERKQILVSYPEALFEKVVSPEVLKQTRIDIKKGEDLDIDTIIELLVEYGFERVDFVYEPGQFSIRGGIVDIFSFGNEWPYRIELFDDEVENIRTFDPLTQLSKQNISNVSIVPNINTRFKKEDKTAFFNVLPEDALIWIHDFQMLVDKLLDCFEKLEAFAASISKVEDTELKELLDERAFIYPNDVIEDTKRRSIILRNVDATIKHTHEIDFGGKPQPSFNKNFNLLIEDLRKNEEAGMENYLLTDNKKQIKRFFSIFEDLEAKVQVHPIPIALHSGFIDPQLQIACYTDHQIFERFHRYKLKRGFTKEQSINLRMLRELETGDFVTHIDHGVGRYSGLEKININGHIQESVRLIYKNNDILYVSINSLHKISKFVGKDGTEPKLNKIGGDAWKTLKRKTKKKVKDIAKELIKLYAERKASKGHAFPPDGYLQNELEASFIYEDTPDQYQASVDVKTDMQKEHPMDRLICGDVGFGKTEVAIRAAFKAVADGKQVAILVPTTILALQHYHTFHDRLKEFGVDVDYVNRFRSTKEKKEIYAKCKEGKVDIVIGTHAILNKDMGFKDLGLLVIDEEQKFGVAAKERLRTLKVNVDTLTLTATPIPRTLQFSLMAARDLSVIRTPPPNRQPIYTERRVFNDTLIRDAIYYEIHRGGQVFFVHNRVKSLPDIMAMIKRICPDVDVRMAHGQLETKALEKALIDFIDHQFDVLVCTNIIETGLDIPNANTIIINNAQQFGLSDLHQLRGRVGRSNKKAFCYLFAPPLSVLTSEARKRIKTIEEFSDLGSGFNIAMKDLDIRGAGNMLGGEQSGFISDIGFETYQKILEEAILELKDTEFKDLFKHEEDKGPKEYVRDVQIETDIEMLIPDEYVSNIQERLRLYTELDHINNEEELEKFNNKLKDRFGGIPLQVRELFDGLRLRWICKELGFERLTLKRRKLRCYFISNPQSSYYESALFKTMLSYLSKEGPKNALHLKQSAKNLILIKDKINNLKEAKKVLELIKQNVIPASKKN